MDHTRCVSVSRDGTHLCPDHFLSLLIMESDWVGEPMQLVNLASPSLADDDGMAQLAQCLVKPSGPNTAADYPVRCAGLRRILALDLNVAF